MRDRTYSTEGIILARRNYGEADRFLTIFTKHYGKIRVIAKGIRRINSRKRGSLELFNYIKLFLAKGHNLDILTEVEPKNIFSLWRKDLTKVAVAYHLCEVIARLTAEHQENREVFALLLSAFDRLGTLNYWEMYPFIQNFKVRTLEELGFLERGQGIPKDLDNYIEELINGSLHTRSFLKRLQT